MIRDFAARAIRERDQEWCVAQRSPFTWLVASSVPLSPSKPGVAGRPTNDGMTDAFSDHADFSGIDSSRDLSIHAPLAGAKERIQAEVEDPRKPAPKPFKKTTNQSFPQACWLLGARDP